MTKDKVKLDKVKPTAKYENNLTLLTTSGMRTSPVSDCDL